MPSFASQGQAKKLSRGDSLMSVEDGGCTFQVYQSAGVTFQNTRQFHKAIETFTKALDMRAGDKSCLIARSMCYLQVGDPDRALADAEATLVDDKSYVKGILQQSESYYEKGQFEFALMHYHRGYKLRPEIKAFKLGIQKSQEAIDNCIGDAAGITLTANGDLSYFYEEQQKENEKKAKAQQKKGGYRRPSAHKGEQKKKRQAQCQKTVKQLLGELYADKQFLENLLKETANAENRTQTNTAVHDLADECLHYLDTRTQFWQQQKPMYSRKYEQKQRHKRYDSAKRRDVSGWILARLIEIDNAQADGKFEESLKISKKTLKQVEKLPDDDIPNRPEIVANLHSCLGNAYLELGNYNKALYHHNMDKEISYQHELEDGKSRSCDNLGRVYARMGEYGQAIKVWEDKIPLSKSALESTWLFHEIGRCHLELGHYGQAREYGQRSLDAANAANDDVWNLNATVLIAQCQVKLEDYEAALDSFQRSLEMARLQGDKAAESAIKRAIEDVNDKITDRIREDRDDQEVVASQGRKSITSGGHDHEVVEDTDKKSQSSGQEHEVVEEATGSLNHVSDSDTSKPTKSNAELEYSASDAQLKENLASKSTGELESNTTKTDYSQNETHDSNETKPETSKSSVELESNTTKTDDTQNKTHDSNEAKPETSKSSVELESNTPMTDDAQNKTHDSNETEPETDDSKIGKRDSSETNPDTDDFFDTEIEP